MKILAIDYVKNHVIDNDLYQLSQSEPKQVERYANIIEEKIFSYIDREQFLQGKEYIYPQELRMVAMTLLQNMYAFSIKSQAVAGVGAISKKTRHLDDYTETVERKGDGGSALSFFGIPIDRNSLDVLNSFGEVDEGFGWWGVNIH